MGLRSQASHPNAVTNEQLGWLDETTIRTVQENGSFSMKTYESQTVNTKAIKIPLANPIPLGTSGQIDALYLEYRGMTGFDSRTAFFRNISLNDGGTYTISNTHGALIRAADCTSERYCMSYLLDMHPGSVDASYPPNRVANAYLFPGESFEVPLNNISIQVLSVVEGESLSVKIRSTQPEKDNFWILVLPAILNDSQSL